MSVKSIDLYASLYYSLALATGPLYDAPRLFGIKWSISRVFKNPGCTCERSVIPSNLIVVSISSFMTTFVSNGTKKHGMQHILSIKRSTPSCPYVRLYRNCLPMPTAFAPKQSAFTMSVPRRMPLSTKTSRRSKTCGQHWRISINTAIDEVDLWTSQYFLLFKRSPTYVSRLLPPWLLTTIPSTPCCIASRASSAV